MTPVEVLRELLRVNRRAATILFAGLAVIAAAAIIQTYEVDFWSAALMGAYVAGLGGALIFFTYVLNDPTLKRVLGWFFVGLIIVVTSMFLFSAAIRGQTIINPPECLAFFWKSCRDAQDAAVARNFTPPDPAPPIPAPEEGQVKPENYRVFIQFAGLIQRPDVKAIAEKLLARGWRVQGADRGGERTQNAIGYNEVRYSAPENRDAAIALARAIQEANIVSVTITTKQVPRVGAKDLEVWISRS